MMLRTLTVTSALIAVLATSCTPWPEPGRRQAQRGQKPSETLSSEEQQRLQLQRELKQKEDELKQKQQQLPTNPEQPTNPDQINPTTDTPARTTTKKEYPSANPVPGKPGFVFSPYNNKLVDVNGIPSGQLVQDPTYPPAEKKYFRVP